MHKLLKKLGLQSTPAAPIKPKGPDESDDEDSALAVGESASLTDKDSNLLLGSQSAQSLSLSVSGRAANGYRERDQQHDGDDQEEKE